MKSSHFVIKQLLPALDWFAVYVDYMGSGKESSNLTFIPLVAWAVVPDYYIQGDDGVVPMIQTTDMGVEVADGDGMVGVVHSSQRENVEDWIERPKSKAAKIK